MDALLWQDKALSLLDQRSYPKEEIWHDCKDYRQVVSLISSGAVQGEAIISCAGAYAFCLAALEFEGAADFFNQLAAAKSALLSSAPASAALKNAMAKLDSAHEEYRNSPDLITAFLATAVTIHRQDVIGCRRMNQFGREIIPEEAKIVMLCRSGIFHTGNLSGAVGTVRAAARKNKVSQVYLCEGRPGLEGARLISHELAKDEIKTTLIPDHTAASLMPRQCCDMVLLDCVSISANGDLLAAPGAYELAISAYFHSIPVYASAFTSVIDLTVPNGEAFPKEDGDAAQVLAMHNNLPAGVSGWTPKHDMLPQYLLTGFITEKGLLFPDYTETIPELLAKTPEKHVITL